MRTHELGDAVGVEFEFPTVAIDGSWPYHRKLPRGWSITRDGSCTRNRPVFEGVGISQIDHELVNFVPHHPTGGEFVSPVYSLATQSQGLEEDLKKILGYLVESGESVSTLTSVHVHVYFGNLPPIRKFKSLLEICQRLEAPIFRLSVAELLEHRGIRHNDYQYCRSILGDGPQYVVDGVGSWRPCFNLEQLLDASQTSLELLQGWGRADEQPRKWVPPRYYWVNPCPLVTQGTIEFRAFNQTFDVRNIMAWVWLSGAIVKTAYERTVNLDQPVFPLGATTPIGDTAPFQFADIFRAIDPRFIPDDHIINLERLWSKAKWQSGILGPQVNHLSKRGDIVHLEDLPTRLLTERVTKSFIDEIWNNGYYDDE